MCNGFQALSDETQYLYCFDDEWRPGMQGVAYNPLSPDLDIQWPLPVGDDVARVSNNDRNAARVDDARSLSRSPGCTRRRLKGQPVRVASAKPRVDVFRISPVSR